MAALAKEVQVSMSWVLPETLAEDESLTNGGVVGFNDNLSVVVNVDGDGFEINRRFFITMQKGGVINCTPEPNWNWNEHNELTDDQAHMVEMLENDGDLAVPQALLNHLYKKLMP